MPLTSNSRPLLWAFLASGLALHVALAQRGRPDHPPRRQHTVVASDGELDLVPASRKPQGQPTVSISVDGKMRVIRANGVPRHLTGAFPNRGNPHRIESQRYTFRIPIEPKPAKRVTPLSMGLFGVAVNGVPFDPGAAEWYQGNRRSKWQYEPLSGAVRLGLDANHAHVQPSGAYHYHGVPHGLLDTLGVKATAHSPIVGWAADGFPIYALYGFTDPKDPQSEIRTVRSSYRLRTGNRPKGNGQPGGRYDGTFVADYEFVKGHGDLDECNGRFTVTPDFPDGTYAYFLSETWPVIPRAFRGTPVKDFEKRRGPGPGRGHPPRPPRR